MKKRIAYLITFSWALSVFLSCTPQPEDILAGSYQKCRSVQNGYYEMAKYWKMMSRNDTMRINQKSYFKKIENDSVLPFLFNSYLQSPQMGEMGLLYTEDELIMYSGKLGSSTPRKNNGNRIWQTYNKNSAFSSYLPVTFSDSRPIPNPEVLASGKFNASYVKQERLHGIPCYHIKAIVPEEFDCSVLRGYGYIIRTEFDYWINKKDSIPIQISISRDLRIGKDTLVEFEKYVLTKYKLNIFPYDTLFTARSLSPDIKIQPARYKEPKAPLRPGEIAPDWRLVSTGGDTLSLSDFKGDLVLMDFFFVSCPACIEILPDLKKLHEKYKDSGLHIIGLDKIDSQKILEYFIGRHGIEYPVLLSNWQVDEAYCISGYPTTYLIGRDGKVLFSHVGGYNHATLERLDSIIRQQLLISQ